MTGKPNRSRWTIVFGLIAVAVLGVWAAQSYIERQRTIRGTWIDMFEGSTFLENSSLGDICSPRYREASWLEYNTPAHTPAWQQLRDIGHKGKFISKYGEWTAYAYEIEFVGRKRIFGLGFGHFGSWPSEFIVDRMTKLKPIKNLTCDIRPE